MIGHVGGVVAAGVLALLVGSVLDRDVSHVRDAKTLVYLFLMIALGDATFGPIAALVGGLL